MQVLQMCKNFEQFVPDSLGEMSCVDIKDFKQLLCHCSVDFIQILGDKQLNNEDVLLHVPTSRVFLAEVWLARFNQALCEILDPLSYVFSLKLVAD